MSRWAPRRRSCNTIAWNNQGDDFEADPTSSISATYTLSQESIAGTGNISADPLFASASDFHLRSTAGRFDPLANGGVGAFVIDAQHSPAIDAADPAASFSAEPSPNGGRANLGAYGNTAEASKSGSAGSPTATSNATRTATPTRTVTRPPTSTRTGSAVTPTATRPATQTATATTSAETTYYVAPNGDDPNPGTESCPGARCRKPATRPPRGRRHRPAGTYAGFRPRLRPCRSPDPLPPPRRGRHRAGTDNSNGDNIWVRDVDYIVLDGFEPRRPARRHRSAGRARRQRHRCRRPQLRLH